MNILLAILSAFIILLLAFRQNNKNKSTTYQIVNNCTYFESGSPFYDGTLWEIAVLCLDSKGDVIRVDNVDPIKPGLRSENIDIMPHCLTAVISFKLLSPESDSFELADRLHVDVNTVIRKGKNVRIIIDNETVTTSRGDLKPVIEASEMKRMLVLYQEIRKFKSA
jgi:hypothetical protein